MPGQSKRDPQHQQEDHDRDDYTPDWLLLRHSCGALNRQNLLMYGSQNCTLPEVLLETCCI
jgi:hypothetical protein